MIQFDIPVNNNQSTMNQIAKNSLSQSMFVGLGFLAYLTLEQYFHFVEHSGFNVGHIVQAAAVLVVGFIVGKILATHLSVCTHEHVDDADITFIVLLVIGSLVHTIFDGSVVHEAFLGGVGEGFGVLFAILFHEVVRTAILYKIIRAMGFQKVIAFASVFGVSLFGLLGGYILGGAIEQYHEYEGVIHLITAGMFTAVTTDLYYYTKHHFGKMKITPVVLGIVIAFIVGSFGGH